MTNARKSVTLNKSQVLAALESLTPKSLEFFVEYVNDAGNWSGTPLFNGNVTVTSERADRGYLTACKAAGLMTSFRESGRENGTGNSLTWVEFTDLGRALAAHVCQIDLGIHGEVPVTVVDDMTLPVDVTGPVLEPVTAVEVEAAEAVAASVRLESVEAPKAEVLERMRVRLEAEQAKAAALESDVAHLRQALACLDAALAAVDVAATAWGRTRPVGSDRSYDLLNTVPQVLRRAALETASRLAGVPCGVRLPGEDMTPGESAAAALADAEATETRGA